jgi:predicted alpha/beta superfamily hydrolase
MKVISREKSNTLLRTEVWTVQPGHIGYRFLITVTLPAMRRPDSPLHGLLTLDGSYACGTAFQLASFLEMSGNLPPAALVSVGYVLDSPVPAMVARNTELTPVPWPEWDAPYGEILGTPAPPSGQADRFLAFLNNELKPALEAECGIDPEQWTLSGHSLGGLFTLHALLSDPQRFRRYFAVGSSLWWRKPFMFDHAERFVRESEPIDVSVYIAAGDEETPEGFAKAWAAVLDTPVWKQYFGVMGGIPDIVADSQRMATLIGQRAGCRVTSAVFPNENHSSAPFVALSQGLRWLHGVA